MLQNGDVIDGIYQIVREIGKGGTGVIYLGYHLRLQKQVIIKRIKDNAAGRMNVRAEADILKRLHHTYLPQVFDFLIVGSGIYTVMDYIPGHDLQYYLDNGYQFPESTIRLWMAELCDVLDYLHSQNPRILHSDIKPANIMITPEGHVCLIDFNVSLDGETSKELQGISVNYAAPEQYRYAMDKLYKFDENGMLSSETPLSFTYLVNTPGGNVDVAVAIQADMAAVGIDMQISEMEWNVFLNDRKAGNFDVARNGWLMDYNDPLNMLEMWTSDSGNNDCQFGKPKA